QAGPRNAAAGRPAADAEIAALAAGRLAAERPGVFAVENWDGAVGVGSTGGDVHLRLGRTYLGTDRRLVRLRLQAVLRLPDHAPVLQSATDAEPVLPEPRQ